MVIYFDQVDVTQDIIFNVQNMETSCKVCGGAHGTGACTEQAKQSSMGQRIESAFQDIGGGIKENAMAKISEYDQRLRAVQEGRPLRIGDSVENLLPDFKRMTKQDWTENFAMEQYRADQMRSETKGDSSAVESTKPVDAERINAFILKLAESSTISDHDAVGAIIKQIKLLETDQNFPEILATLDPESYDPQTKQLNDKAKERLEAALNQYTNERGHK